jgi:hypothetical protein
MWLSLLGIVQVAAMIWVAALILAVRDRARRPMTPTAAPELAQVLAESRPFPLWKRVLFVPLAVVIFPPTVLVLLVLAAPFAVIAFVSPAFFWLRFKLFGKPIPDLVPPEGPAADA